MPLNVLAVTDQVSPLLYEYFDPERWGSIDLILSCGDLPPDYLGFLVSSLNVPLLYVRGNHDAKYRASAYDGCDDIHGKIVEYRGVRIAGFEGCMRYNLGSYQYSEAQMRRLVRRARLKAILTGRPDIVIAHAPPAGCHDAADACHRGFECFRDLIQSWQPALFIHGHTHAYNGIQEPSTIGSTQVINAFPYTVLQIPDVPVAAPSPKVKPRARLHLARGIGSREDPSVPRGV
jgi:predicted phosphodiesterase